jgi:hypothetical protein
MATKNFFRFFVLSVLFVLKFPQKRIKSKQDSITQCFTKPQQFLLTPGAQKMLAKMDQPIKILQIGTAITTVP